MFKTQINFSGVSVKESVVDYFIDELSSLEISDIKLAKDTCIPIKYGKYDCDKKYDIYIFKIKGVEYQLRFPGIVEVIDVEVIQHRIVKYDADGNETILEAPEEL